MATTELRDGARVDDICYDGPAGDPVTAYLVQPAAPAAQPGPGVLAWHWFDTEAPDGDRTQFLDEAVTLAGLGVTSLLPQGRFPWTTPPSGAAADHAAIEAEVARLHAGLALLGSLSTVDPQRIALIGHDFGGMLAAVAAPDVAGLRALVVIAATPRWADWFLPFWPIPDDRLDYLGALRPLDPIERIGAVGTTPVLFQFGRRDFFIAAMTGLEFRAAAPDGARLLPYDDEHGMRDPQIRADRLAFLRETLGLD
jgi:dienelactone hydrolase